MSLSSQVHDFTYICTSYHLWWWDKCCFTLFTFFLWQYYFEGRFDLVKFVKTVQEAGLFVHLHIGPYACAEWNYGLVFFSIKSSGLNYTPCAYVCASLKLLLHFCTFLNRGFPLRLHFIPGIQFHPTYTNCTHEAWRKAGTFFFFFFSFLIYNHV